MIDDQIKTELAKGAALSIIDLLNYLVEKAASIKASDIHIDPAAKMVRIRMRVDGVLRDSYELPLNISSEIIQRIKVLSRLRTDEHQATQDGRFRHNLSDSGGFVDVRVSIAPTYHGENAVLRLLSDKAGDFDLESLGFSAADQKKITQALQKATGMILATGPTGSGKTTTLYTLIKLLNSKEVSIVTIEDPIEYAIEGIEQIQVNAHTSLTFATGLRSILRQDPNIIMVGEIRDLETANIAVNTALTGHLLLSTLHTNDAATTMPRLIDMEIEPYLVASTVNIAIGQRLVRKICGDCKEAVPIDQFIKTKLRNLVSSKSLAKNLTLHRGKGCEKCDGSGYLGRVSINEVLEVDNDIRGAIIKKVPSSELRKIAIKNGMATMFEDGLRKVAAGATTLEEVLRVVRE